MSNNIQFDHQDCCGQCGAAKVIWTFWRRGRSRLTTKRSYICGHQWPTPKALRTIFPIRSIAMEFRNEQGVTMEFKNGEGVTTQKHLGDRILLTTRYPPGAPVIMTETVLYPKKDQTIRPANSDESLASQVPLAYHMAGSEGSEGHYSPTASQHPSLEAQFTGLHYQQAPHLPYHPSPLNPDRSFGNQQSGHPTYIPDDYLGNQMYQPHQQSSQFAPLSGNGNAYHETQQIHHFPGVMGPPIFSDHSQEPSSSGGFYPPHQYGGQVGFMTSQLPHQGHSDTMGYGQGALPYSHSQHGQQNEHQSADQGMSYHVAPNMGPQGQINHHSGNYGFAPALNHPQPSANTSFVDEGHESEFEEPEYKSSGFVPPVVLENLRASQTSQKRESKPSTETQPYYESDEYQANESDLKTNENSPVLPVRSGLSRQNISPRAAPATDPLPARSIGFVGSPEKSSAVETPSRHCGDQVTQADTPATLVPSSANATPQLRSRKGQSVSTLKIDPVRGPPPAFWPGASQPATSTLAAAPLGSMYQGFNDNFIGTAPGSDPFMTAGYGIPPSAISRPMPQGPHNLFVPIQPAAGPLAPLILPAKQAEGPSRHLSMIAPNATLPTVEVALDAANVPFIEYARVARPVNYGVVKITNIPYNITRAEIVAFLGRNARIVNEAEEPIHIIMERVSSKTMEAYVEFVNMQEAVSAVNRYEINRTGGRGGRLGERHVELEVSGQEKLMQELFPKARNVHWDGSRPVIIPRDPNDPYNSGFKGFVTSEEMVMLVKHVEAPQRSPFSKDCPQRPYECLISTLVKYPWYMVDDVTLEHRELVYRSTRDLVQLLVNRLNDEPGDEHRLHVNDRLLRRVRMAVFRCAGFTERQKDDIAFLCGLDSTAAGLTQFAHHWTTFKTIGPKPGIQPDVVHYYVALLREAITSGSLAERAVQESLTNGAEKYFGTVTVDYPENVMKMSLGQIAKLEWNVIEMLLRQRLAGVGSTS